MGNTNANPGGLTNQAHNWNSNLRFGGKTFTLVARNASKENKFIQSARLNGKPLNQWWIRQKDILQGGRLELELGPAPNQEWAKGCPLPD
ncbi:MAG: glycoside hydrolase domain-containing protein [Verrucomicrobiota bacterium]